MKYFLEKLSFICICYLIYEYSGAGAFPADGVTHLDNQDAHEEEEVHCPSNMLFDWRPNECVCIAETVYYPPKETCFNPFEQGPCKPGHYLAIPNDPNVAECVVNTCGNNGTLPYKNSCYSLLTADPCEEQWELLRVSLNMLKLECRGVQTVDDALIEAPIKPPEYILCPPGNRRTTTGQCKKLI